MRITLQMAGSQMHASAALSNAYQALKLVHHPKVKCWIDNLTKSDNNQSWSTSQMTPDNSCKLAPLYI